MQFIFHSYLQGKTVTCAVLFIDNKGLRDNGVSNEGALFLNQSFLLRYVIPMETPVTTGDRELAIPATTISVKQDAASLYIRLTLAISLSACPDASLTNSKSFVPGNPSESDCGVLSSDKTTPPLRKFTKSPHIPQKNEIQG
jgi:hypothetical protein